MTRDLVNAMRSDWSVHFIGPVWAGAIGPLLLLDGPEEVIRYCDRGCVVGGAAGA